jgi:hypothetical protein
MTMKFGIHHSSWLIGPDPAEVKHKLDVLRRHCDAAAVAAKRERLAARGPLRGFLGTVSEAIDLIGQYQDAGVELLINSDQRNDVETRELFASDVMPHFA